MNPQARKDDGRCLECGSRRTGMSTYFAHPSHMPCPECGASVAYGDADTHECDPERLLDYLLFELRDEVAGFDVLLAEYLDSPQGRFAQWHAECDRANGSSA